MPNKRNEIVIELPNGQTVSNKAQPTAKTLRNRRRRLRRKEKLLTPTSSGFITAVPPNTTRSGATPNPADPRSTLAMAQLGSTSAGRLATMKMLHPNGENDEYVTKVPDGKATTSIVLERRDEFVVQPPPESVMSTSNWNVILIETPFLIGGLYGIRWSEEFSPSLDDIGQVVSASLRAPGGVPQRYPTWAPLVVNATTFESTVFLSATLSPAYVNTARGPSVDIKSLRRTYCGLTVDLDASELYNEGRVVAGQWQPDVALTAANITGAPAGADVANLYTYQIPAYTDTTIVQSDEASYQAEAKHGLYLPVRPSGMEVEFTAAQEWRNVFAQKLDIAPGLDVGLIEDPRNDLWLRGWLIGVSYWSNLNPHANLRLKRKEGLEIVATPTSLYSPFATPALPNDLRAAQIVQEFCRKEPHGYPADFNELGKMLQGILGKVGSMVADLGIPIISDVARQVQPIVHGNIGNTLAGLLDSIL